MGKTKRILALLLAVVMVLGLAACSKPSTQPADSNASTPTPEPQKEITINFPSIWVGKDSKATIMGELITKFNEENAGKIKVVVEEIGDYQAYRDKMRTNITTGNVPDIFTFDNASETQLFFRSDKLMDLTAHLNDGWKNNFIESAIKGVEFDGKIVTLPFEFGVTPVWYNTRLLEKAKVTELPKTYTEFFAMCDKLKAAGIAPMSQMTGENAWTSMLWYSQLVVGIGGQDVYKNGFDDPAFLEAAKMMQKMYKYTTKDAVGAAAGVSAGHWLNERTAIFMNGPWFVGRLKKEGIENMYDFVNVAPAPVYEGGKGKEGAYIGFIQAYIGAAKQTDKAKEQAVVTFLKYLTNPDNVKKVSMASGALFVVKVDLGAGDGVEKLQAQMIEQSAAAPYVVPHFQGSVKPGVASEFPQALSALILGEMTPEKFVEALKKADSM